MATQSSYWILLAVGVAGVALLGLWLAFARLRDLRQRLDELPGRVDERLESNHRGVLQELHSGLAQQSDRLAASLADSIERLRAGLNADMAQTRGSVHSLQLAQTESLLGNREQLTAQLGALSASLHQQQESLRAELLNSTLQKLAEHARADQELIQATFQNASRHLSESIEALSRLIDNKLAEIGGRVNERLEEGFKKTNETFVNVVARLATIDEAQKNIEGLASNVVSLQQLLGDKRARGAFGEVQLEALVRNILPPNAYEFQYTLPNKYRVDCVLKLPEPTGLVSVDSKFPLENFNRMLDLSLSEIEREGAKRLFKSDLRKHVDDIGDKYIVTDVTSDGAVMFVPAEAVFAEIHAHHPDIVEYALQKKRVWICSPTTLMAVLNTARAVLKDVETRKQVHIIKDELGKLGKDFGRFEQEMQKLAKHIEAAYEDAQRVTSQSQRITKRFSQIERVELEKPAGLQLVEGDRAD